MEKTQNDLAPTTPASAGMTGYKWLLITGPDRKTIDENGIMGEPNAPNWFYGDKETMMEEAERRARAYKEQGHADVISFYACSDGKIMVSWLVK